MIQEETRRRWRERARFLVNRQDRLSTWELRFLGTIAGRLDRGEDISFRESRKLREIFKREELKDG